jgi:hypothetical protein
LVTTPSPPVDFFGPLGFFFFFSFFLCFLFSLFLLPSRSHYFYYCKLANTNYTQNRDGNNTKWNDGNKEKGWKPFPPQNKLVKESKGNEENRYPVPDTKKPKIDYPKELNKAHKNILKEEILQVIIENFMEMILNKVNQNLQEALKKFHDNKNKEYEKIKKPNK